MIDQNQILVHLLKNGLQIDPHAIYSKPAPTQKPAVPLGTIPKGVIDPLTVMPDSAFISHPTPGPPVPTDESVDPWMNKPGNPINDSRWK
jgi:hypothetical protein